MLGSAHLAWYRRSMWRWLSAEPRDVVDLAGPGTVGDGSGEPHLGEELRRWRGIVGRRRLIALLRRHAAVALVLAALLEILAQLGAFPQWVVIAAPLALFLLSVAFFALRGPSPFGLARLLDDKLGLNDRLATALEIEARGGAGTALEARTVGDAAGLLRAGREDWHASAVGGRQDWWAVALPVVAIAAAVGVGSLAGSSSTKAPETAFGPGGGPGGTAAKERQRKKKKEEKEKKALAPTGKLHKIEGVVRRPEPDASRINKGGYQKIPQGYKNPSKTVPGDLSKGGANGKSGRAPTGKIRKSSDGKAGETGADKQRSLSQGTGKKEKEHPTVGFNVKTHKKNGNGRRGTSEVKGGRSNKPSVPNGKQDETSSTASESGQKGTPTGAGKAGGEQGNNSQGHATPIKGQASQAVKIQPGYAPSRSSKGGKEHKKPGTEEGAGGKARTAQVTGATQVGSEFSFVPAAGGALPAGAPGLQQNYTESLKWVERLPW
jgi:hypothetical protein